MKIGVTYNGGTVNDIREFTPGPGAKINFTPSQVIHIQLKGNETASELYYLQNCLKNLPYIPNSTEQNWYGDMARMLAEAIVVKEK